MSPKKDIRQGFEERLNIFAKLANMRVEYRIGSQKVWQTQISLMLYVSCNIITISSIEEPTTKGSRRERSLVHSCKIIMSGANEATTERSYCSVLATVLPPTPCHLNVATLLNKNWWLRLGFAARKFSRCLMNECPRIKIKGRPMLM